MSDQNREQLYRQSPSNIPIPDPSLVTVEAIERVKNELRADYSNRIDALRESLTIRLNGMEKASELLDEKSNRIPTQLERETGRIKDLFDEKFKNLETQLKELAARGVSDKETARDMVRTALDNQRELVANQNAANKEAVAKSDFATSEQIRSLGASMTKQIDALAAQSKETQNFNLSQITDLKTRLDRGEGVSKGAIDTRGEHRSEIGSVVAIIGCVMSGISILIVIALAIITIPHSPPVPVTVSPQTSTNQVR